MRQRRIISDRPLGYWDVVTDEWDYAISDDYFSTVAPDPFEPPLVQSAAAKVRPRARPATMELRPDVPAGPITRQASSRGTIRPIPLTLPRLRTLADLYPLESLPGRLFGLILTTLIILAWLPTAALIRSSCAVTTSLGSPTLDAAARRVSKIINSQWSLFRERLLSLRLPIRLDHWLPSECSTMVLVALAMIAIGAISLFLTARRLSGSFGGWLAAILFALSATLSLAPLNTLIAVSISTAGLCLLVHGWRRQRWTLSFAAAIAIGLSADFSQPTALLLIPLLIAAIDLPWRWSWSLPIAWALPIAALAWSDWKHFGVLPDQSSLRVLASLNFQQSAHCFVTALTDPARVAEAFLTPIALIAVGLLTRFSRRWGLLLLAWCLPAVATFLIGGSNAFSGDALAVALPTMILATIWLTARSAMTASLLTALLAVASLHATLPRLDQPIIPDRANMPIVSPSMADH